MGNQWRWASLSEIAKFKKVCFGQANLYVFTLSNIGSETSLVTCIDNFFWLNIQCSFLLFLTFSLFFDFIWILRLLMI